MYRDYGSYLSERSGSKTYSDLAFYQRSTEPGAPGAVSGARFSQFSFQDHGAPPGAIMKPEWGGIPSHQTRRCVLDDNGFHLTSTIVGHDHKAAAQNG